MKVLLANKFFFRKGGAETVFFNERAFLQSVGIQVVDFSMSDRRNDPSPYSEHFVKPKDYHDGETALWSRVETGLSLIHSREAVKRIERLVAQERPDIVHCHNIYHQLTPSILLAAKRVGAKTIMTLHDYKVVCPIYTRVRDGHACGSCERGEFFNVIRHRCSEGSLGRSALLFAEATFQRLTGSYESVDCVIVPSEFMGRVVTRWRFPSDRVRVIHNGVNLDEFKANQAKQGYALYFGRLSKEKGLLTLAAAQAGTGMRVIVAGTGPMEQTLRQDFPGLELVGHRTGPALRELVEGASCVILASEWEENCPMSILEAMAAGKAVIASRMGGIPELVEDGITGILFAAGDIEGLRGAMRRILLDQAVQAEMGRQGRIRAEAEFSDRQHNAKLLEVYQALK
jgi:glycosyltransferase involved in cell wall biosynthesis